MMAIYKEIKIMLQIVVIAKVYEMMHFSKSQQFSFEIWELNQHNLDLVWS